MFKTTQDKDSITISIKPALEDSPIEYSIKSPFEDSYPVIFSTFTTDMRDSIGNVISINKSKCSVKTIFRGHECILHNVIIADDNIKNVGQRVMITEHLNIDGKMELLATTKRILIEEKRDINFVNVGWSNKDKSSYLRIDVYTGEVILLEGDPIRVH